MTVRVPVRRQRPPRTRQLRALQQPVHRPVRQPARAADLALRSTARMPHPRHVFNHIHGNPPRRQRELLPGKRSLPRLVATTRPTLTIKPRPAFTIKSERCLPSIGISVHDGSEYARGIVPSSTGRADRSGPPWLRMVDGGTCITTPARVRDAEHSPPPNSRRRGAFDWLRQPRRAPLLRVSCHTPPRRTHTLAHRCPSLRSTISFTPLRRLCYTR